MIVPSDALLLVYRLLVAGVLIAVSLSDVRSRRIPNRVIGPAAALALIVSPFTHARPPGLIGVGNALLGLAIAGGIFLLLYLVGAILYPKRRPLGEGDVKLAALIGMALGWPDAITAILLGTLAGALIAVVYLVRGIGRAGTLPYGPALAMGALIVLAIHPTQPLV